MSTTVRAGASKYAVALSSAITGTGDSTAPSGDIIYIGAEKVTPKFMLNTKPKHQPGRQSFSTKDANKYWKVDVSNAFVDPQVAGTTIEEMNVITEYLESWTDLNKAPIYLIVANAPLSGTYKLLRFKNHQGTRVPYLRGYITDFTPVLEANVSVILISFSFEECWM